jgi:hypothetical protein
MDSLSSVCFGVVPFAFVGQVEVAHSQQFSRRASWSKYLYPGFANPVSK